MVLNWLFTISIISWCSLIDYRFSNNIGQVFYDYSGNNFHAVNGDSSLTTTNDVSYSDRGIYFSLSKQTVRLPPNNLITKSFTLTSPFSVVIWFYVVETTNFQVALYRRYTTGNIGSRFTIFRQIDHKMYYHCGLVPLCSASGLNTFSTNKNVTNTWEIAVYSTSVTSVSFSITGNLLKTMTLPSAYSEGGMSLSSQLGETITNTVDSMRLFMYRFLILNSVVDISTLYSSSAASYTCLATPCASPCQTAFKESSNTYCLPLKSSQSVSANNTACSCSYGCSNEISCLNPLSCLFNSTFFNGTSKYCLCGSLGNSTYCAEPTCFSECLTCKDYYTCLTCKDTNSNPDQVSGCICKARFYNTTALLGSTSNCKPCLSQCKTCNNGTSCIECLDSNAFIDSNFVCQCKQGFYNASGVCVVCENECLECNEPGKCLSCKANHTFIEAGRCKCLIGYFNLSELSVTDSTCSSCLSQCKTCSNGFTCIECIDSNALIDSNSICQCKQGYYNSSGVCIACNSECLDCNETEKCLSCKASHTFLELGRCKCLLGYFNITDLSVTNSNCYSCSAQCRSCSNEFSCIDCLDLNAFVDSDSLCQCKQNFYNLSGICTACEPECADCIESGKCLSCKANNTMLINGSCRCLDRYFNSSRLENPDSCVKCMDTCITCENSNTCLMCQDSNAILVNGLCECRLGHFIDFPSSKCIPCHPYCLNCSDSSSCLACKAEYSIPKANDYCECYPGFWPSTSASELLCEPCLSICLTCGTNSTCLTCHIHSFLNHSGLCECLPGHFAVYNLQQFLRCDPCDSFCASCESKSECLSCKSLSASLPLCECNPSYFPVYSSSSFESCEKCHQDCLTCNNSSSCQTCLDPDSQPADTGCNCIDGFWRNQTNNTCQACPTRCLTCNSSECLSCKSNFSNILNNCSCDDGFWEVAGNFENFTCQKCQSQCATCNTAQNCLSCKSRSALAPDCQCQQGFWAKFETDNFVDCFNCKNNCKICTEFDTCLECFEGFWLFIMDGVVNDCIKCPESCLTCESNEKCTQCLIPNSSPQGSECLCIDGYLLQTVSGVPECVKCINQCETCNNLENCTKCKEGYFEVASDSITKICIECHPECKTCNITGNCIECLSSNTELIDHKCRCKPGFWNSSSLLLPNSCIKCYDSCFTCHDSLSCDSCFDKNANASDLCKCKQGYFLSNEGCKECEPFCTSCGENNGCQACFENFTLTDNNCVCSPPRSLKNGQCVQSYFKATLTVGNQNDLRLFFQNNLRTELNLTDFSLIIPGILEFKLVYLKKPNKREIMLKIDFKEFVANGTKGTLIIENYPVISTENQILLDYSFNFTLKEFNLIPTRLNTIISSSSSAALGITSTSMFVSLNSNPSSFWVLFSTLQLMWYIPLSTFKMTAAIRKFCSTIASFEFLPNIFSYFIEPHTGSKPFREAGELGIDDSNFILNFGIHFTVLVGTTLLLPIVFYLSNVRVKFISKRFSVYLKDYKYNFYLRFLTQSYLDLGVFGIYQIYSVPAKNQIVFYFSYSFASISIVRII